jgi:hypothetical protein
MSLLFQYPDLFYIAGLLYFLILIDIFPENFTKYLLMYTHANIHKYILHISMCLGIEYIGLKNRWMVE